MCAYKQYSPEEWQQWLQWLAEGNDEELDYFTKPELERMLEAIQRRLQAMDQKFPKEMLKCEREASHSESEKLAQGSSLVQGSSAPATSMAKLEFVAEDQRPHADAIGTQVVGHAETTLGGQSVAYESTHQGRKMTVVKSQPRPKGALQSRSKIKIKPVAKKRPKTRCAAMMPSEDQVAHITQLYSGPGREHMQLPQCCNVVLGHWAPSTNEYAAYCKLCGTWFDWPPPVGDKKPTYGRPCGHEMLLQRGLAKEIFVVHVQG